LAVYDGEVIKEVVYDSVPAKLIERIIIFGSRARNEEDDDSDTDICIIVNEELTRDDIRRYRIALNRTFAFEHQMAVDIMMRSMDTFNRYKGVIGGIEHVIASEGVML